MRLSESGQQLLLAHSPRGDAIEAPFPIHSKLQRLYGAVSCADRFSVDFDEPFSAGLPYLDAHGATLQDVS
jgi:hypothetical protein